MAFLTSFILFFLLFFCLLLLLSLVMKKESKEVKRLKKYLILSNALSSSENKKVEKAGKRKGYSFLKKIGMLLEKKFTLPKLEKQLKLAGYEIGPGEFFIRSVLIILFTNAFLFLLFQSPLLTVITIIISVFIPGFILKKAAKRRNTLATLQLIQALGIMANSLKAGYSFLQVIKLVSEEFSDPIGKEFGKVIENMNLGLSLEESFEQLKANFANQDLDLVLTSILIQRESGGDLAKLLESVQETMLGRLRVKDEVRTLTAQGKLSMWVIMFVPVGLALYLQLVNPDYIQLLFQHALGWMMLSMAVIGVVLGYFVINKIVSIEV